MSKARTRKPTRKDFEKFKAEFMRCVDLLNLNDWNITFLFEILDDNLAQISTQSDEFLATVSLSSNTLKGKADVSSFNVKQIARHEVAHLFHARLRYTGKSRFVRPDDFYEEDERLSRVMEKILEIKN